MMNLDTFEQFLQFMIENKINFSAHERSFLRELPKDTTMADLLKWYDSPLRKYQGGDLLPSFRHQNSSRQEYENLFDLTEAEIKDMLNTYKEYPQAQTFAIFAYAQLKAKLKDVKSVEHRQKLLAYHKSIIDQLVESSEHSKNDICYTKLRFITKYGRIYSCPSLVQQLAEISARKLYGSSLESVAYSLKPFCDELFQKYFELCLQSDEEIILPTLNSENFETLNRRQRAKDAILKQTSIKDANTVCYAALNNGIYRKKQAFSFIADEPDSGRKNNLRRFASLNRVRRNIPQLIAFKKASTQEQTLLLNAYLKKINDEFAAYEDEEKRRNWTINNQANEFYIGHSSLKKTKRIAAKISELRGKK